MEEISLSKYADRCTFERTYTEEIDGISIVLTFDEARHFKNYLAFLRNLPAEVPVLETKRVIDGIFSDLSIAIAKENREGNATR